MRTDAERLDWLERIALEAIEIDSFISDTKDDPRNRVFIDWAESGKRIASGTTIRETIDNAMEQYPKEARDE